MLSVEDYPPAIQFGSVDALVSTLSWRDLAAIAARKSRPFVWTAVSAILRCLIVLLPVFTAGMIARNTRPNAHCDEYVHIDAFEYFRTHWLRPPVGSADVLYSINGISRAYNGEIVYFLFGKAGYVLRHIWPQADPYYIYRGCNIGLLFITLTVLVTMRCKWFAPWLLAIFLICIPQVIYTFAYANSDAFGVAASVLLFAQAACMLDQSPREWTAWKIAPLMLFFLLTLLSKVAFEIDILLPALLLAIHLIRNKPSLKWIASRLLVPMLVVYLFAAWWNPMLSPRHAAWQKQMMDLRQEKAIAGRKPTDPQPTFGGDYPTNFNGLYLAANHGTYQQVLTADNYAWLPYNAESVYGRFAYMMVVLPIWMYAAAAWSAIALCILTLFACCLYRKKIPWPLRLCILIAFPFIALNLLGSLYHSFHYDWQPQGRYMFASLVPLFFLCFGTWAIENKWWRIGHVAAIALLIPLCAFILIHFVALNPTLGN